MFGSILGAVAGPLIGGLMGGGRGGGGGGGGSYGDPMAYLNAIKPIGEKYFNPYIEQGKTAGARTSTEYGKMLDDPTAFVNQIMQSYQPSKGYEFRENRLKQGAANNAAAGGFSGTQYDNEQQSELVNALLSEDMQQYLDNILGVHGTGLAGKENIAQRGFNASQSLADFLGSNATQQAGLAHNSQQQNMQRRDARSNAYMRLGSQLGGALGGIFNGGFNGGSNGGFFGR